MHIAHRDHLTQMAAPGVEFVVVPPKAAQVRPPGGSGIGSAGLERNLLACALALVVNADG